jgi:hypothetical protein
MCLISAKNENKKISCKCTFKPSYHIHCLSLNLAPRMSLASQGFQLAQRNQGERVYIVHRVWRMCVCPYSGLPYTVDQAQFVRLWSFSALCWGLQSVAHPDTNISFFPSHLQLLSIHAAWVLWVFSSEMHDHTLFLNMKGLLSVPAHAVSWSKHCCSSALFSSDFTTWPSLVSSVNCHRHWQFPVAPCWCYILQHLINGATKLLLTSII